MRQDTLKWKLSRHLGVGSDRVSKEPSKSPEPPSLPLGHPNMGLRNRWYLLRQSKDFGEGPEHQRVLGEDLVLWRDADGIARVMRDYCPHRGARLSLGDVVDGELQCWYHAWRFDGSGQCTSVPTQGGKCSLQRRLRIEAAYPTEEQGGYVWGWIGEQEPAPLELPEEFTDPAYASFPESVVWQGNWTLALENLTDVLHAPFLHNNSLTLSKGIVDDRVRVDRMDDGFDVRREGQSGVNFDWIQIRLGPLLWCRLEIPYPSTWTAGPGPNLTIIGLVTPIDDTETLVHFPRFRKVDGWQRTVWQALYRARLRGTHLHVLNQDKYIIESQRSLENARLDEHPAQSDKGVIELRRRLAPDFEEHFAALRERGIDIGDTNLPIARQSFKLAKQQGTDDVSDEDTSQGATAAASAS
jgi:phenylpropionate dioxygenase-like ring-hydroxylating dioxygenase large terminal subunit